MQLQDKIIVITGASQGLGKAIAEKVAKEGAKVVLVARSEDKLRDLKHQLGESAEYFLCDVADNNQTVQTVKAILEKFERIDILINNAGIWTDDEIEKNRPERRKEALETNTLGNIQFIESMLPSMKEKNAGHIFTVISTSGDVQTPAGDNKWWKTYGATKWAMTGYTKALRDSLQGTKIKVTGFFPGGFDSNLYENAGRENPHQQPWMMKTDDIADIVLFILTLPDDVVIEALTVTKGM